MVKLIAILAVLLLAGGLFYLGSRIPPNEGGGGDG